MTGIIDTGGGLRGIFGAGVFDRLLDEGLRFDYCIGVSAGAANICSFLGCQRGRNYLFYTDYALRPEYMSFRNFIHSGSYLDLEYVYGVLSNSDGENPLDFETLNSFEGDFQIVCTNCQTAEPVYFDKTDFFKDNYAVLKATCCLPVICRPVLVGNISCFDGGVSDPIPIKKAFENGCDKIVIILTRPVGEVMERGGLDLKAARITKKRRPAISSALERRYQKYNEGVAYALELEKQERALILSPDDITGLKILTKDCEKLEKLYNEGYKKAAKVKDFI